MQKAIYLLQESGVPSCGSFYFTWDKLGPYSPELGEKVKEIREGEADRRVSGVAAERRQLLARGGASASERNPWDQCQVSKPRRGGRFMSAAPPGLGFFGLSWGSVAPSVLRHPRLNTVAAPRLKSNPDF